MSGEEKHLTIEQIARLAELRTAETDSSAAPGLLEETELHLASCEQCQEAVSREEHTERSLRGLAGSSMSERTVRCPEPEMLYEFAGGLLNQLDSERIMEHTVECDHCGPRLGQIVAELSPEHTADEVNTLATLESSKPKWQKKLARRLAVIASTKSLEEKPEKLRFGWKVPRWVWAAPAFGCLLVLGGALTLYWRSGSTHVNSLLAEAYSEERRLELRIPGARYAPLRVERGADSSRFAKPTALLEAEEIISRQLSRHSNDPAWLQAKARAELLEGNYDAAIRALEQATGRSSDSPVYIDLASAYFLRAENTHDVADYGRAVETISKVLLISPNDPVALYNRALIYERTSLFTQAIEDWEHYLVIDPRGPWSDEATRHLDAIKAKLKHHQVSRTAPLQSPGELAKAANGVQHQNVDARLEDYVRVALTEWLPQAYRVRGAAVAIGADYRAAMTQLANVMIRNHEDPWLRDLVSGMPSQAFGPAVVRLSGAILANDRADVSAAQRYARDAASLFRDDGHNEAGVLLARLEIAIASNVGQDGTKCRESTTGLREAVGRHSYHWLEAQVELEEGSCYWLLENLGLAHQKYVDASRDAAKFGYKETYLKAQDHLAGVDGESGQFQASWDISQEGLRDFWSRGYPDVRGYNFYYELSELARAWECPHLQMATWREGIALNESSADIAQTAIAHSLLGVAAMNAHIPQVAEREFLQADHLFSLAPQIESTRVARLEAETRLAKVEASNGDAKQAIARLKSMQASISDQSDKYLAILFYDALGEAEFHAGDTREAASALGSAVGLAEIQLSSLKGEPDRIAWEQRSGDAYRELTELYLKEQNVSGALEIWEWYRGAPLRAGVDLTHERGNRAMLQNPPQLEEVARQLPSLRTTTVVSYALLPRGLATWVFDDHGVATHWLEINPADIRSEVARFRDLCSDRSSLLTTVRSEGRSLYDLLVAPMEQRLAGNRTVVFELDDGLSGLPVEALVDSRGHYFADRGPMVSSLGSYYQMGLREPVPITRNSSVLVAAVSNPMTNGELGREPLPDTLVEGEMVAHGFRSAQVLTDDQATLDSILSRLPRSEVFHFAGHAFSSMRGTGLLLSDDLLTADSVQKTALPKMQLAVFSACDSQEGSGGRVDDADSLVRTFLRGGVPHVVASRWRVDSATTREFMSLFYLDLLRGGSVPGAIYDAKALLRSKAETAHPFYWSAFSVFGAT